MSDRPGQESIGIIQTTRMTVIIPVTGTLGRVSLCGGEEAKASWREVQPPRVCCEGGWMDRLWGTPEWTALQ